MIAAYALIVGAVILLVVRPHQAVTSWTRVADALMLVCGTGILVGVEPIVRMSFAAALLITAGMIAAPGKVPWNRETVVRRTVTALSVAMSAELLLLLGLAGSGRASTGPAVSAFVAASDTIVVVFGFIVSEHRGGPERLRASVEAAAALSVSWAVTLTLV